MWKIYSKRIQPPLVEYSKTIPANVRKRILYAINEVPDYAGSRFKMLEEVENRLLLEYGELSRSETFETQHDNPVIDHYLSCSDEHFLDFLELLFHTSCQCEGQKGVNAINAVLDDAGIGYELSPFVVTQTQAGSSGQLTHYEYVLTQIVVKGSPLLHSEAVEPALRLLIDPRYKGANEEYLRAHEYYRKGDNIGCLNECLKAFESTMKIICHEKGWAYNQTDTASKLIRTCLDNGLLPAYSQQHLTSVRTLLETAIPTPRNKTSGHGQGVQQNIVPDSLAKFALHTAATTILFLIEAAYE